MTSTTAAPSVQHALQQAAARGLLAPSVHNTQPWHFTIDGDRLIVTADRVRQLHVLDPSGRQLMLSCGCALLNIRASLAAQGFATTEELLPNGRTDVTLAVLAPEAADGSGPDLELAALEPFIDTRQTNRRRFADDEVPDTLLEEIYAATAAEGARLVEIRSEEHRMTVARLSQRADGLETANPAYRAEIRAWTTDDPNRKDGVPSFVVPHVDAGTQDEIPIRDFDSRGTGWLPVDTHSSREQCLLLLGTTSDDPESWLRAGQALERVWLQVTRRGFAMSLLTQIIEVPSARAALRSELALTMQPHVLIRIGRAPITPASPRRDLADVLDVRS